MFKAVDNAINYLLNAVSLAPIERGKLLDMTLYPVKSCGGYRPSSWEIDEKGLILDRHWMLVDENGNFIGQHEYPHMALICPVSVDPKNGSVEMHSPNCPENILLKTDVMDSIMSVHLFGETVNARGVGEKEDKWFSMAIGASCYIVSYLDIRSAIPETVKGVISFSSESQFLCLFEPSFNYLRDMIRNERGKNISIESFRGNLTVDRMYIDPFDEQKLIGKSLKIGDQIFHVSNGCDRCKMINVNQYTGKKSGEPHLTLSKLYKDDPNTPFGIFLVHDPHLSTRPFILNVGDRLVIS